MKTKLAVYVNADDALLLWTADAIPADLRGFAIQRERNGAQPKWLDNFAPPGPEDYQDARHHTSADWPFRRFSWTDHEVNAGDRVRYRVVPVFDGEDEPRLKLASRWSARRTLGARGDGPHSAYFNRGFVISQFLSRYLDQHFPGMTRTKALAAFKKEMGEQEEGTMRAFLAGDLRATLLRILHDLKAGNGHAYAALFELTDTELTAALAALGPRAHVVLANGSIQQKKGEKAADARRRDANAAGRKKLDGAGVDVKPARMISPGALGHNKFLVATSATGKPRAVWTGSTNWSTTGLCTQLNNGVHSTDKDVAAAYLKQWHDLRDAGSEHPAALTSGNGAPAVVGGTEVHFTRVAGKVDLAALSALVKDAKEGILFLMFRPGGTGLLADLEQLAKDKPKLLVRGVVSDLPLGSGDEQAGPTTTVRVTTFGDPSAPAPVTNTYDVVQPRNMRHVAAGWAVETTRKQFKGEIGFAIIHSKVLVIDPFSAAPTIVTGSHNFSISASKANDENFLVIRGDRTLAQAYAVNIQNAWQHYAPRAGARAAANLRGTDYLKAILDAQRREEPFWRLTP